jgi:cell division protein FtsL
MRKSLLSVFIAAVTMVTAASPVMASEQIDAQVVAQKQKEIHAAEKELQDLSKQLAKLRTHRKIEFYVVITSSLFTVIGGIGAMVGDVSLGYDGRRVSFGEKVMLGARVVTPAAIAVGSGALLVMNSDKIDDVLQKIDKKTAELEAANQAWQDLSQY